MFKTTRPHRHHGGHRGGRGAWNPTPHPHKRDRFLPFILAGALWRWRWELLFVLALAGTYRRLTRAGYPTILIVILFVVVLTVALAVPATRRFTRNRFWCVMDRHRLRVCMNELRTYNYSGKGALILTARATKEGEALWLWLRPGMAVGILEQRTEAIAAACWARDARVCRSAKLAALVRVEILRRDSLPREPIRSPLLATTRHVPAQEIDPVRALRLIQGGSEQADAATDHTSSVGATHAPASTPQVEKASKAATKSTTPATGTTGSTVSPVISRTGEDVSDYV